MISKPIRHAICNTVNNNLESSYIFKSLEISSIRMFSQWLFWKEIYFLENIFKITSNFGINNKLLFNLTKSIEIHASNKGLKENISNIKSLHFPYKTKA